MMELLCFSKVILTSSPKQAFSVRWSSKDPFQAFDFDYFFLSLPLFFCMHWIFSSNICSTEVAVLNAFCKIEGTFLKINLFKGYYKRGLLTCWRIPLVGFNNIEIFQMNTSTYVEIH